MTSKRPLIRRTSGNLIRLPPYSSWSKPIQCDSFMFVCFHSKPKPFFLLLAKSVGSIITYFLLCISSCFQNNVEIHVAHIQSGLSQLGNLHAFAANNTNAVWAAAPSSPHAGVILLNRLWVGASPEHKKNPGGCCGPSLYRLNTEAPIKQLSDLHRFLKLSAVWSDWAFYPPVLL